MMQYLLSADAAGVILGSEPDLGIVTCDDALKAVSWVASFIDGIAKLGGIDAENVYLAVAMLMVVRDYSKLIWHE